MPKMENKKGVTILVVIALILAIGAIALRTTESNQIQIKVSSGEDTVSGQVGVDIIPAAVEDKLTGTTQP